MESSSHINNLPDDLLVRILLLLPTKKLHVKPKAVWSDPAREFAANDFRKPENLVPTPPAFTDAAISLQIAAVCKRWRRLAQHQVSTLLVREPLSVSLQDLSNAISCFPNLTHLHMCDGSVESLDDAFLTHLASSCPKLKTLHVGTWITEHAEYDERKELHPVSEAGLDRFFQQSTQLEHLSLYCLHTNVKLPASFFRLTNLRSLVLPDFSALEVPAFTNLTLLTALSLTSSKFQHQQLSSLVQLVSLTSLSFFANQCVFPGNQTYPVLNMAWLSGLKSLELMDRNPRLELIFPSGLTCSRLRRLLIAKCERFRNLPDNIGGILPSLQELSIRHTNLAQLPDDFTSLSCLESLTISRCNQFSSLSDDFGQLPALRTLVLDELPKLHLPDSFCNLMSLEVLCLISCETIRQLPTRFCSLTTIRKLVFRSLPIETLPMDIGRLTNLESLLLYSTGLSSGQQQLPASFTQLSSLKRLKLFDCMVGELPEDIWKLRRLQELIISSNAMSKLPKSVSCLVDLQVLAVRSSGGIFVPKGLQNCRNLKLLELPKFALPHEPLEVLPSSLATLRLGDYCRFKPRLTLGHVEFGEAIGRNYVHLKHLEMVLKEDAKKLPFPLSHFPDLRTLEISRAKSLKNLPGDIGSALKHLRKLELHDASCLTELPASVTELQHLTSLKIHAAKLTSIPDAIGAVSRLRKLCLRNCTALEHLPSSLTQLSYLRKLDLSNTSIRSLPPHFVRLTRLAELYLSNCRQLQALPKDMTQLKMLYQLDVGGCTHLFDSEMRLQPPEVELMYGLHLDYDQWE